MEEGGSKVKQVLSNLWSYLYRILPPTEDFIIQLDIGGIIDRDSDAPKLRASARLGDRACIHDLITHMYNFFNEKALEKFCTFLDKYGQSTSRPLMLQVAAKIREEIGFKLQPVHELAPEDPQKGTSRADVGDGTSSADLGQNVYYPVIDDLKISFSNLASNVLSIIGSLTSKNLETFCYFLSNYLKPSFPPDAPLPVIPETFPILKLFLIRRWDPLQIALLKAVVQHLASRRIQAGNFKANVKKVKAELNAYEDLLKGQLPEFLSKCRSECVSLQSYPGQSSVSVKIASKPAEISLSQIVKFKDFFIHDLGLPDTMFTGFSEGCIVLFFSIPTECVWSLPSCLHPSNLSLLEELKVLFFSVKGAFTVDITERRVVHSLDKKEYTVLREVATQVQEHDTLLQLKYEEAIAGNRHMQEMVQQLQDQKEELENEITTLKETLSKDGQSTMLAEILKSVKSELPEQISAFGKDSAQLQQDKLHAAELREKDETIARKNKEIGELKLAEKNDLKLVLVALQNEIAETKTDVRHALKEVGGGGPAELEAKKLKIHLQDVREQLDLIRGLLEEKDTQRQKEFTLLREVATQVQEKDTVLREVATQVQEDDTLLQVPRVVVQKGGMGGDGPSSSQSSTCELTDKVFSEEDAALRLGIVAALDLSEVTSQQTYIDAWLAKDPPHRKIEAEFCRLQSRLAKIFNKHIDDLKPFLLICQRNEEWPFTELEVEDIEAANNIGTIFNKMPIEKCWLNTEIFIRLIDVLPDKKSHDKAKRLLEDYHKLLGVFSRYVLLSHIPKDDARLEHFHSRMFPKLRVTYDVNMEDFAVSKLLEQQKFLSRIFHIPEEAFHYLQAKPTL